jgi:alanine-glyoxylate transaminase/serine-glyoxylate transaminase/serine-pyruvate transaminase
LLTEHHIEVAGGFGALAGKVWRIGLMGHAARAENVDRLLTCIKQMIY